MAAGTNGVLYACRRWDGLIKIGYSENFERRAHSLEADWGTMEFLGTRPGTTGTEYEIQQQFKHLLIPTKNDWFSPGLDLLCFIASEFTPVSLDRPFTYTQRQRKIRATGTPYPINSIARNRRWRKQKIEPLLCPHCGVELDFKLRCPNNHRVSLLDMIAYRQQAAA